MSVYSQMGVCEVMRWVLDEARGGGEFAEARVATSGGISQARARLGASVMEALYRRLVAPIAVAETKGAWLGGLRVVSLDGSTLELQDTGENALRFGGPETEDGPSGFPHLRFVSLVETGTHVLFGAEVGSYGTSEQALARKVLGRLEPGMLCMADRLFYGIDLWELALSSGAHLLWRVRKDMRLPAEERLGDGSYLSTVYGSGKGRRKKGEGRRVRVVEYRLAGEGAPEGTYRLLTSLFDHEAYPAGELAALYPQRWEIETAYDEFKTHLRGGRVVLRSKSPQLVEQEFYGFLLAHFCIRQLMHQAALSSGVAPLRLGCKHSVEVLKRRLPAFKAGFSPRGH
jgi:hypothetical protein